MPSCDVTLIVIGKVPEARASTLKRIVLLPGLSVTVWSGPSGKSIFVLSRCTRTVTSRGGFRLFSKLNGTAARRDVSVMRFSSAVTPDVKACTAWSIWASAAWARSGEMLVDSVVSSASSPRTTAGSRGPTTSRKADSSFATVSYSSATTGVGAGTAGTSRRWTAVPSACSFEIVASR